MDNRSILSRPSRRTVLLRAGQAMAVSLLAGCVPVPPKADADLHSSARTAALETVSPPLPKAITPTLINQEIALEEKIGQMILVGFYGTTAYANSAIIQEIRTRNLGGVALFRRNVQSAAQLMALTGQLQAATATPLLISVDQEGGYVRRLGPEFGLSHNYTPQQLGSLNNLVTTQDYAAETAQALKDFGLNLNLAPVVDLNVNPSNPVIGRVGRSFSADPAIVTDHARTFIDAHHQRGVLCTLKHFPGHGSSTRDSHKGFVDVTSTWTERELEPFASIIQTGRNDVIMTAHIFNANLDDQLPATLSRNTLTGLLRNELGHDGVIMTDDMQMAAIRSYYSFDKAVALAVDAGVDMIAIARYAPSTVARAVTVIQGMVANGTISADRVDASYRRILNLKSRLALAQPIATPLDRSQPDKRAPEKSESDDEPSAPMQLPLPPNMLPGEEDLT